ncbi:MAG: sulfotransferase [Pseudomonadota bacterium]
MKAPLIILCPMRSFSSVVCALLGVHPQLYGLPELNLFIADDVDALLKLHERRPHGVHGLLRTLAQLHDGEQTDATIDAARAWLEQHRQWTTKRVFDHLLDLIGDRIAVDKSPRTVLRADYMARAWEMYPEASFLHLTRHPRSTAKSLLNNIAQNADWGGTANVDKVDPENIWVKAHQNIVDFTDELPLGQSMRIKGEELISHLDHYLVQLCEWLDIDASDEALSAMKHPETSPYACPGPDAAPLGNDPDFLANPVLRPGRVTEPSLDGELDWAPGQHFSKPALKLARQFGYS